MTSRRADITLGQLLWHDRRLHRRGRFADGGRDGTRVSAQATPGQSSVTLTLLAAMRDVDERGRGVIPTPRPSRTSPPWCSGGFTEMELQDYIGQRLAKPMGWGCVGLLPAS